MDNSNGAEAIPIITILPTTKDYLVERLAFLQTRIQTVGGVPAMHDGSATYIQRERDIAEQKKIVQLLAIAQVIKTESFSVALPGSTVCIEFYDESAGTTPEVFTLGSRYDVEYSNSDTGGPDILSIDSALGAMVLGNQAGFSGQYQLQNEEAIRFNIISVA